MLKPWWRSSYTRSPGPAVQTISLMLQVSPPAMRRTAGEEAGEPSGVFALREPFVAMARL
jgi:hypothetical protein